MDPYDWRFIGFRSLILLFLLGCGQSPIPSEFSYRIQELGSLGGNDVLPYALNNRGEVVGVSGTQIGGTNAHAFFWSKEKGMVNIWNKFSGVTPTDFSRAMVINDQGWLVVFVNSPSDIVYRMDHGILPIEKPEGRSLNIVDLNDDGMILGAHYDAHGACEPFIWSATDGFDYFDGPGWTLRNPIALNDTGDVLIQAATQDGTVTCSFLWKRNDGWKRLPPLDGFENCFAVDMNDKGQIVGVSSPSTQAPGIMRTGYVACLWEPDSVKTLGEDIYPTAINDEGTVVGRTSDRNSAVVLRDGVWRNLSDLIEGRSDWIDFTEAVDINDSGQIVGYGFKKDGQFGFILTPLYEQQNE
ncbi:MAG: hypothetical protein KC931_02565 [Candidatus Omnitrophica bacterium]|nr:hypothetical protein [Candidatus Omnitrophota bacterium]